MKLFPVRKSDIMILFGCKVIHRNNLTIQHRVLVMNVRSMKRLKIRRQSRIPRIKWWHLEGEKLRIF